jgi:hypothetical protein
VENPPRKPDETGLDNQAAGAAGVHKPAPEFSISRVVSMVVIIGIVAGAGYGIWTFLQTPKVLVPFSGRVIFEGKPVTVGGVATMRLDDQLDSATGALDEDGRFVLRTNGEPGAYTGRHKLVITSNTPTMPPRALIPPKYSGMSTTPLIIDVSDDPAKNQQEFVLEGTLPGSEPPPAENAADEKSESEKAPAAEKSSDEPAAEGESKEPAAQGESKESPALTP